LPIYEDEQLYEGEEQEDQEQEYQENNQDPEDTNLEDPISQVFFYKAGPIRPAKSALRVPTGQEP